jgi:Fic family protein
MKPPYRLTPEILSLLAVVSEKSGMLSAFHMDRPKAKLRKANRVRTIHSSLSIEGNTLSMDQVSAILEGKEVEGPKKDILEVRNAISVYERLDGFKPTRMASFLSAHRMFMDGILPSAGKYRTGGVGILKGSKVAHVAPPASRVHGLMKELFTYLKGDKDPALIKSCVFHYEMEFIHPFEDGNGRMGRLWQTVLLKETNAVFSQLPVENVIKKKQNEYYRALGDSDKAGHSTPFIRFMLSALAEALDEQLLQRRPVLSAEDRIMMFKTIVRDREFSRKEYMRFFTDISSATASRDLRNGVSGKHLVMTGDKRTAVYRYVEDGGSESGSGHS